ncbi:glycoside hydrolase family 32 protein [Salipaludibacillus sp. HK11]|uniref:glycoside hydrolase family 32 protein n=1 Tax=Salipaludibacillus sp. HK11 TaxID=3394320 RepID=UPI0039FCA36A
MNGDMPQNNHDKANGKPVDRFRPKFHMTPPFGLMNDPNGFIYYVGKYHTFYQWNPNKTVHATKYWGHFTSENLFEWKHENAVLAPEDWFDCNGCYSGSAIEHEGNLIVLYTGNVLNEIGDRETYQCMAISKDGMTFDKKGPVLHLPAGYTAHFRDPKVWKKEDTWYMVVGAQSETKTGKVALFSSTNLTDWEHHGAIAGSHMNGLGDFGYMWECPDLFSLSGKDVLIVSPQGLEPKGDDYHNLFQSGYFIGEMDYQTKQYCHGDFRELDRGFEFYAPQTTIGANGQRILIAWMGMPDESEEHHPTIHDGWIHAMTLPRELTLFEGKLYQKPVKELEKLRTNEVHYEHVSIFNNSRDFKGVSGQSIELIIDILTNKSDVFSMRISNAIQIDFDSKTKIFSLTRKNFQTQSDEVRKCKLEDIYSLNIFIDLSTVEIFINGGEEVFSSRFFSEKNDGEILFHSKGEVSLNIKKWEISQSICF